MVWIESHQELARHPKTKRLARQLGCSVPAAIGHLHLLWWWATDYASDGDLSVFPPDELADALLWEGDPAALIDGLQQARFLDGLKIHDWEDYAGRLIDRRYANAERMRKVRATADPPSIKESAPHVQRTTTARAGLHTVPTKQTEQTVQTKQTVAARAREPASAAAPESLRSFDSILRELPGYRPTTQFFEKVLARYPTVDHEMEAIKIADWVRDHRKQCTTARVFNWLDKVDISGGQTNGAAHNGISGNGGLGKHDPELDRYKQGPSAVASGTDRGPPGGNRAGAAD